MDDLKAKYGDRLWLAELDLSEIASIRGIVDRAWAALDRIDVVVSNAGYRLMGAAEELTDEQVRHRIDTNLASLENRLGARLFNRTTRNVALTNAGHEYVEAIAPALSDIQAP
jgi:NAD(P)-dependent dehydrogenase (short-subunit alcohol dehydrogenase family)